MAVGGSTSRVPYGVVPALCLSVRLSAVAGSGMITGLSEGAGGY